MPAKGYRKADSRDRRLQIRVSEAEHKILLKAARQAGYRTNLSRWIRDLALAEAEKLKNNSVKS
jgi:uncharacterized protein (DUF1778 family)